MYIVLNTSEIGRQIVEQKLFFKYDVNIYLISMITYKSPAIEIHMIFNCYNGNGIGATLFLTISIFFNLNIGLANSKFTT